MMTSIWINRALMLGAISYIVAVANRQEVDVAFLLLLLALLLMLVLKEVLTGTVAEAEKLMLASKYTVSRKVLNATLFPSLLLPKFRQRFFSVKAALSAEEGDAKSAKAHLAQAIALGLDGTLLIITLTKILKHQSNSGQAISQIMSELKMLDANALDPQALTHKVIELLEREVE
ncbi:MAG: hypothetical protein AB8F95_14045 [Bacteroidia bacterium]